MGLSLPFLFAIRLFRSQDSSLDPAKVHLLAFMLTPDRTLRRASTLGLRLLPIIVVSYYTFSRHLPCDSRLPQHAPSTPLTRDPSPPGSVLTRRRSLWAPFPLSATQAFPVSSDALTPQIRWRAISRKSSTSSVSPVTKLARRSLFCVTSPRFRHCCYMNDSTPKVSTGVHGPPEQSQQMQEGRTRTRSQRLIDLRLSLTCRKEETGRKTKV